MLIGWSHAVIANKGGGYLDGSRTPGHENKTSIFLLVYMLV